jgi:hypothetical protein
MIDSVELQDLLVKIRQAKPQITLRGVCRTLPILDDPEIKYIPEVFQLLLFECYHRLNNSQYRNTQQPLDSLEDTFYNANKEFYFLGMTDTFNIIGAGESHIGGPENCGHEWRLQYTANQRIGKFNLHQETIDILNNSMQTYSGNYHCIAFGNREITANPSNDNRGSSQWDRMLTELIGVEPKLLQRTHTNDINIRIQTKHAALIEMISKHFFLIDICPVAMVRVFNGKAATEISKNGIIYKPGHERKLFIHTNSSYREVYSIAWNYYRKFQVQYLIQNKKLHTFALIGQNIYNLMASMIQNFFYKHFKNINKACTW